MGVFTRISNMVKGKVNATLDDMENPIELLDQKIREMEESLNKAKLSSAQVLGNVHETEKKLELAKKESADYDEKVKLAMSKGNEDLAKRALQRKLDADKKVQSLTASYNQAKVSADALKKNLKSLEDEIQKTRSYRDEAAARSNNADASKQVNEILANVQTKKNSISLDDVERKIQRKEAMASGLGDLKEVDDLDKEFESLEADVDLDAELAKYKTNSDSSSEN
ncbi:MAG: PspA/IM30 family protein [Inconstantimicrobium porci]|uniref:PspA/IM30 family protein n=2 Tax=Inconstantimicrobium porci TaxID=2652291 RepID=UPI002A91F665|nr:PspA/IM30 family protein [Inconstantimicrobium porci]MDY5911982.1 PspA/IM30 family protein [Inconstantimicrobium porci]